MLYTLVGYRQHMNNGRDNLYMKKYLEKVSRSGLNKPRYLRDHEFLLIGALLLDFLAEDTKKVDGWKYPKLGDLELYQERRGLNLEMLEQIEVRQIICGISSSSEIGDSSMDYGNV